MPISPLKSKWFNMAPLWELVGFQGEIGTWIGGNPPVCIQTHAITTHNAITILPRVQLAKTQVA
jgi:hypothetical protein